MKKWTTPEIKVVSDEQLNSIVNNVLTIESSLYASGCHQGMTGGNMLDSNDDDDNDDNDDNS